MAFSIKEDFALSLLAGMLQTCSLIADLNEACREIITDGGFLEMMVRLPMCCDRPERRWPEN